MAVVVREAVPLRLFLELWPFEGQVAYMVRMVVLSLRLGRGRMLLWGVFRGTGIGALFEDLELPDGRSSASHLETESVYDVTNLRRHTRLLFISSRSAPLDLMALD